MKRQKGCFNDECISFEKKEKYPEEYTFCPKCAQKLQYVCNDRKCYTLLKNPLDVYCQDCKQKRIEQKEKAKELVAGVPGTALTVVSLIGTLGQGKKNIAKLKGK